MKSKKESLTTTDKTEVAAMKTIYGWPFFLSLTIFTAISSIIFYKVNEIQPEEYMDEIFHGPQTRKFCNGTFDQWDPKITTLPGTYFGAAGVLNILQKAGIIGCCNLCSIYNLRLYNLLLAGINFFLIQEIQSFYASGDPGKTEGLMALTTFNIATSPVLYFFTFLYYTDVTAVTFLLLMHVFYLKKDYFTSSLFGALSVFTRQSNIIWVIWHGVREGMNILSETVVKTAKEVDKVMGRQNSKKMSKLQKKTKQNPGNSRSMYTNLLSALDMWKDLQPIFQKNRLASLNIFLDIAMQRDALSKIGQYLIVTIFFAIFVVRNGGIVVGDKEAHQATINFPQVGYFTLMYGLFCFSFILRRVKDTFKFIIQNYKVALIMSLILVIVVQCNTVAHPYLLADNRHYTFYIWKRLYQSCEYMRLVLIPFYIWVWFFIWENMDIDLNYRLSLIVCACLNLIPQLLFEFRYFIPTYLFIRVTMKTPKLIDVALESFSSVILNIFVIYMFLYKPFSWQDSEEVQRFMW